MSNTENLNVSLTAQNFKDEGVEVKLTQNDILEIIADSQQTAILGEIKALARGHLSEAHEEIYKEEYEKLEAFKQEMMKKVSTIHPEVSQEKILKSTEASIQVKPDFKDTSLLIQQRYLALREKSGEFTAEINTGGSIKILKENTFDLRVDIRFIIEKEIEGGKFKETLEYSFKKGLEITNEEEKANKIVKASRRFTAFQKKYESYMGNSYQFTFNFNKMTRDARIKLNKSILNAQAPDIKKALKKNFKIDLNA